MAFNLERPDLKPLAQDLIDVVRRAVTSGSEVPLLQVVELFGIELSEAERERLRRRGSIRIDGEGEAVNEGEEEVFSGSLVNIRLPRTLRGRVRLEGGGFVLDFAEGREGIAAKRGFVKATVRALKVYPDRADLEMSNKLFTLHFTW